MIHMEYYLIVSTVMMFVGIYGFVTRRNLLAAIAIIINIYRNIRNIGARSLREMKW